MTNSFDRLLREALEAPPPDRGGSCLDAETVAAWCDGSLDATARAAAEAHAADCARCQAFLAAMMRVEPPPLRPWWRSPAFGWMAPLAVGAAALLIWVNLPTSHVEQARVATSVDVVAPAPTPAPAASAQAMPRESGVAERAEAAVTPGPPSTSAMREARSRDQQVRQEASAAMKPAPITPLTEGVGAPVPLQTTPVATPPPAVPVAAPTTAPLAAAAPAPVPPRLADAQDALSKSNAAAAAPSAQPTPVPELPVEGTRKDLAETVTITAASARRAGVAGQTELIIRPPDNRLTRWRITLTGFVQRTTDNGATWETQPTGAPVPVTAGAAPSETVCWLVGRGGLVLLSTDGRTWTRLKFPQARDLVAVEAANDKSATVTAVSGRVFTTTDGGKSWK